MSWLTERLSTLMHERGHSVETLARLLGIERSRLANILRGSAAPNENLLRRMARQFDESPEEWVQRAARPTDEPPAPDLPTDFIRVAALAEVPEGEMKIVFNDLVVIANAAGRLYAFGNICPHAAGPIGDGILEGCVVECPWHSGQWDIATGNALNPLATAGIPVFDVRVVDDTVEIRLTPAVLAQKARPGSL